MTTIWRKPVGKEVKAPEILEEVRDFNNYLGSDVMAMIEEAREEQIKAAKEQLE